MQKPQVPPLLYKRTDTAARLAVSQTQVRKWETSGLLRVVRLPGLRAVRHSAAEVDELAGRLLAQGQGQ